MEWREEITEKFYNYLFKSRKKLTSNTEEINKQKLINLRLKDISDIIIEEITNRSREMRKQ